MKVIESFTNKNGVDIVIFSDQRIYCNTYVDDGYEVEYTFKNEKDLLTLTEETIETIDQFDLIYLADDEYPDIEDFQDIELEDSDY